MFFKIVSCSVMVAALMGISCKQRGYNSAQTATVTGEKQIVEEANTVEVADPVKTIFPNSAIIIDVMNKAKESNKNFIPFCVVRLESYAARIVQNCETIKEGSVLEKKLKTIEAHISRSVFDVELDTKYKRVGRFIEYKGRTEYEDGTLGLLDLCSGPFLNDCKITSNAEEFSIK